MVAQWLGVIGAALALVGSAAWPGPEVGSPRQLDPAYCRECHPEHYREWSGSMHAYAGKDPVFLAMNHMGQDATRGRLADFCVRCHAPLAVRAGLTRDGLNLPQLPEFYQAIGCVYCHSVDAVEGTHNAALHLAEDGVLRGGIADPWPQQAHGSAHSALHSGARVESSALCGTCHDIVTPSGLDLERTYREWRQSRYGLPAADGGLSCGACHMPGRDAPASNRPGSPLRRIHSHRWPAVDTALGPFPEQSEQRAEIRHLLDATVASRLCVASSRGQIKIDVALENIAAGHAFPSGAAQDRRLWVQLVARQGGRVVFQSGTSEPGLKPGDRSAWVLRDWLFDRTGRPTHRFWDGARRHSRLLPAPRPNRRRPSAHHRHRQFVYRGSHLPDEVELRVQLRPIGADVLEELVRTGYLPAATASAVEHFTLGGATQTWHAADRQACVGAISAD